MRGGSANGRGFCIEFLPSGYDDVHNYAVILARRRVAAISIDGYPGGQWQSCS